MSKITGTLYKQTSGSLVSTYGEGYFIALQFDSDNWNDYDSVEVSFDPELDFEAVDILAAPNKSAIFKIQSPSSQVLKVVATKGSETVEKEYDLSEIEGRVAPGGEIDTLFL